MCISEIKRLLLLLQALLRLGSAIAKGNITLLWLVASRCALVATKCKNVFNMSSYGSSEGSAWSVCHLLKNLFTNSIKHL